MSKIKVIVDTDTGIDDAMGCVLALRSPELDVIAMTSVFGNVGVDLTTQNTAYLLEALGRPDVPLARGAERGLVGVPSFNPEVHGSDGIGDANFPRPRTATPHSPSAAEFIVSLARANPGEVTFIGLGPLTNLALALMLDSKLPDVLPRVVWMGGAVRVPGNVSPVAEADALHDPEAAQLVIEQAWNLQLVALDVTDDTLLRAPDLARIRAATTAAARYVATIAPFYMDFYAPLIGEYACAMHSPLAVGVVAHPEFIVSSERLPMTVELTGTFTRGMTIGDRRRGRTSSGNRVWAQWPEVELITSVDRPAFMQSFLAALER